MEVMVAGVVLVVVVMVVVGGRGYALVWWF